MRRKELVFVGTVVILLIVILCLQEYGKVSGYYIEVSVQSEVYGVYELSENQIIEIEDRNGLTIENGIAYMEWATCANQLCVHQGVIGNIGESIVCLPHKVVVQVVGEEGDGL